MEVSLPSLDDSGGSYFSELPSLGHISVERLWDFLTCINNKIRELEPDITQPLLHRHEVIPLIFEDLCTSGSHCDVQSQGVDVTSMLPLGMHLAILRNELRMIINVRIRPTLRQLTISDLPDELLAMVFDHLEKPPPNGYEDFDPADFLHDGSRNPHRAVQSVRLTCRRFKEISSYLLLRTTKVHLTKDSIERFQQISTNSVIGKRVERVGIYLDYYCRRVAKDWRIFAAHCGRRTQLAVSKWPQKWIELRGIHQDIPNSRNLAMNRAQHFFSSLPAANHPSSLLFRKSYVSYKKKYADQQILLKNAAWLIAAAMANLPLARRLYFKQRCRPFHERFLEAALAPTARRAWLMMMDAQLTGIDSWALAQTEDYGKPPVQFLLDLFSAIRRAGVQLVELQIPAVPATELALFLVSHPEKVKDVIRATDKLKRLEIYPAKDLRQIDLDYFHETAVAVHHSGNYAALVDSMAWLAISEAMVDLRVNITVSVFGVQDPVSLGRLIRSRPWPKIEHMRFCGTFWLFDVQRFVEVHEGRMPTVELDGIPLTRGSGEILAVWADILDILRGRVSRSSVIGLVACSSWAWYHTRLHVSHPAGNYIFKPLTMAMPDCAILGINRATAYVRGDMQINPARAMMKRRVRFLPGEKW